MSRDEEFSASPEISEEYRSFEEFSVENSGRENDYLELAARSPLQMDSLTLAFSMRHLMRMSGDLLESLLVSLVHDAPPDLLRVLKTKGVELGRLHAEKVRGIIFAFRDSEDPEVRDKLSRAFQLMAMGRAQGRVALSLGESYNPPEEGWLSEDFGGDEFAMETVLCVENPVEIETEET
jgi:hypothetical protein